MKRCSATKKQSQMFCCDCSFSCCIFNDALLFCINLEFLKLKTQPALRHRLLVFCLIVKKPLLSLFSNKSATDTHGNTEFLTLQSNLPSCQCPTLQGVHSFSHCLPSIMQSLMDSTEGRGQGAAGPLKGQQLPLPPFYPQSICGHA